MTLSWQCWTSSSEYLWFAGSTYGCCSLKLKSELCNLPPTLMRPFASKNGFKSLILESLLMFWPDASWLISWLKLCSCVIITQYTSAAVSSWEVGSPWVFWLDLALAINLFTHAAILSTFFNLLYLSRSNSGSAGSVLVSCTAVWYLDLSSELTSSATKSSSMLSAS